MYTACICHIIILFINKMHSMLQRIKIIYTVLYIKNKKANKFKPLQLHVDESHGLGKQCVHKKKKVQLLRFH